MGDMIFLFSELENMKDRYDRFLVCPPYEMVRSFRGDTDINFPKLFLQTLFGSDTHYSIIETSSCSNLSPDDIESSYRTTTTFIDLSSKFIKEIQIPFDRFVAINTKVRYITKQEFRNCFTRLVPVLKGSNLPIVIFGERTIPPNPESSELMFSIYDDIITSDLSSQIHDLTKPTLLDCIDIEVLKNDLSIMYGAISNITFGVSGIATLITATAKNVSGYRNDGFLFLDRYYASITDNRKVVTKNIDQFLKHIENCIKESNV
ncbi:MAG: hypothetical protein EHM87_00060 [Burkholderiales bacterium]|nr:MAG: hypothetical protein EHM87_00060 [Burkholderiales bacterium]